MSMKSRWLERYFHMFLILAMQEDLRGSVKDSYIVSLLTATVISVGMYIVFFTTFAGKVFGVVLHPVEDEGLHGPLIFAFLFILHWLGYHLIGHEVMQRRMDVSTEEDLKKAYSVLVGLVLTTIISGALIVYFW